jgi:hypothetical protein
VAEADAGQRPGTESDGGAESAAAGRRCRVGEEAAEADGRAESVVPDQRCRV